MTMFATGLTGPDEDEVSKAEQFRTDPRDLEKGSAPDLSQPIRWIRDQRNMPSCVGHAFAACVDAARMVSPWCSAINLWQDAVRRASGAFDLSSGTRLEFAAESLVLRGWDDRDDGEEGDPKKALRGPTLEEELQGFPRRHLGVRRYKLWRKGMGRLEDVDAALAKGMGVVFGTGTRPEYHRLRAGEVATPVHLGGRSNGHAQRIAGRSFYEGGRRKYMLQNSWGEGWGTRGTCWADESVVREAWDIYVIEIKP